MGYNYPMLGFAPYGPYWREIRKIATLQLLSNGQLELLKQVHATEIAVRIKELHRLWAKKDGFSAKVDLKKWCGDMTLNVVLKMVVRKRCFDASILMAMMRVKARELRRFREAITQFFYLLKVSVVSDLLPFVEWLDLHGYKRTMRRTAEELNSVLVSWLEEHRRRRFSDENNDNQDFMDVMLSIMEGAQFTSYDLDTIIKATCMGLILGGTDTTSVSLAGALSYMASNHHILNKAQDELDMNISKDRNVDKSDIKNLSYFTTYSEYDGDLVLMDNNCACKMIRISSIHIRMYDGVEYTLTDVRHIPNLKKNMISLASLEALGCKFVGYEGVLKVFKGAVTVIKAQQSKNLYRLIGNTISSGAVVSVAKYTLARV
ncbi:cytochrome P450 CYP82D47-like [Magnolia sinica]|uniref:cytochrome P450 CYP82D47-like n=1 Tax=Magnolia sinica TaxID=86752 RepID=UPI002659E8D8|nr:cytochrome P450 CYP82D47-like [Magnolia sinica]